MPVAVAGTLLLGCSGDREPPRPEGPSSSTSAPSAEADHRPTDAVEERRRVTLDVGHCYVEPIRVGDQTWVTRRTYIGYGGVIPRGFTRRGTFVVAKGATEGVFLADGGAEVRFTIAPDPMPTRGCR